MRKLSAFVVALAMVFGVVGCGEKKPATPGEALDKGIEKTGDAMKKAGEEIKKAGEEVKKEVK